MKAAAFTVVTGLILTLGGVGGIEHNEDMASALVGTAVGLAVMAVGSLMVRRATE